MQELIKNRIKSYLNSNDNRPLVIDVPSVEERDAFLLDYYHNTKQSIFDLTAPDAELPEISSLYEFMENCNEKIVIITDFGTYLKLYGLEFLQQNIHALLEKSFSTKFLILTFQCANLINETSPKTKSKVIIDNEQTSVSSTIVLIDSKYNHYVSADKNLGILLKRIERSAHDRLYALTEYQKSNFPNALLSIEECKSAYDLLCLKDPTTRKINRKFGENRDWEMLLEKLEEDSIEKTISEFINLKDFTKNIEEWTEKNDFEKWLSFIYAKLKNIKTDNWAIDVAINKSQKSNLLLFNIYTSLLETSYKDTSYWKKYEQRKQILKEINDETEIFKYCNLIKNKNEEALYYLTDNTVNEKNLIIQLLDQYYQFFSKTKLLELLKHIYRDLYNYLSDFNLSNDFLNEYFSNYKYLKVINHLTPEFKEIVDKEAVNRSYKRILMYRTEKLEEMSFNNSIVYFIDALGVEFLSYIARKCESKGLAINASVVKANLPTITSENTEFRMFFAKKGVEVKEKKELDELKHDGKNNFDFDKNKLPIHLVEEFRIIDECIVDISKRLKSGDFEKAVIVSDHGATRLAILNEDIIKIDVESAGEHGGRVCKAFPNMEPIPNAALENDYCILGDYNSFKGGRTGKVEMHGGATLEEVIVPIIEIVKREELLEIKVISEIIKVSFKKNAVLEFYSSNRLANVSVQINGSSYVAKSSDGFNFVAELPDIKKSGSYEFDVWSNNKLISSNNEFTIEKESAKTNNLWE